MKIIIQSMFGFIILIESKYNKVYPERAAVSYQIYVHLMTGRDTVSIN